MPTIFKGCHRPLLPSLGLFYGRKHFNRLVTFTPSCRYNLEGVEQWDINKLFGVGYFPHHHKESARFGWVYHPAFDKVELMAYCYIEGNRKSVFLCSVPIDKPVRCHLYVSKHAYFFWVVDHASGETIGECSVDRFGHTKWGYPLGLYFGGNNPAPHSITVKMKPL